jgi:hypothetical protein
VAVHRKRVNIVVGHKKEIESEATADKQCLLDKVKLLEVEYLEKVLNTVVEEVAHSSG